MIANCQNRKRPWNKFRVTIINNAFAKPANAYSTVMLRKEFSSGKTKKIWWHIENKSIESSNCQSTEIIISRFSGLNYEELKTKQKV